MNRSIALTRPNVLYEGLAGDTQSDIDGLGYQILSDADANAAIALGIAFHADPAYVERLRNANLDIAESSIEREGVLPVPAVFAIGTDGRIAYAYVNADHENGRHGQHALARDRRLGDVEVCVA